MPLSVPAPAPPRTHEEYVAVFDSVKWESKDPENPFLIGQTKDRTTVKGPAFGRDFERGRTYKFCGKWTSHPKFGRQFEFAVALEDQPHDLKGCVAYMLRLLKNQDTGIGEKTAARLYAEFGSDCVRMLREQPKKVSAVAGIDLDGCLKAAAVLGDDAKDATTKIELLSLLDGKGFPRDTIAKVIEIWGPRAPTVIRRDAFQLLTSKRKVPGAGFKRVDKLYLDLGGHPARLKRQALCAWHACREAGDDTWHVVEFVRQAVKGAIGGVDASPEKAVRLAVRAGWLVSRMEGKQELIAIAEQAKNEADVARIAARMVAAEGDWPEVGDESGVSPHQAGEVAAATLSGRLGILAGTPGTGKTFSAAAIIKAAIEKWGLGEIAVAAPTGKAAVRINEAMQIHGIGVRATTIHSLLGPDRNGHGSGDWAFRHNAENPLPFRLVVIDECFVRGTMVDTPDGERRIESIKNGDRIYSAAGVDRVLQTKRKEASRVIKITSRKKTFICSENHPFFTRRGWVVAAELRPGDSLVSTAKAMRLLRGDYCSKATERGAEAVLRLSLLGEVADDFSVSPRKTLLAGGSGEVRQGAVRVPCFRNTRSGGASQSNPGSQPDEQYGVAGQVVAATPGNRAQAQGSRRQRNGDDEATSGATCCAGERLGCRVRCRNQSGQAERIPDKLQNRYCQPGFNDRNRDRRPHAQRSFCPTKGPQEGTVPEYARVESSEVLESSDPRLDRFREADGKLYLYDLSIERHPSFSVNGCLVHNCSMVETDLAGALFRAIDTHTHVLFIGDPYQLPPVGHGAPLRDLIKAGVPAGELTEVRRNAGMIVEACRAIKDGDRIAAVEPGQPMDDVANLKFVPCGDTEYARELLEGMYGRLQQQIESGDESAVVADLKTDVQLIVAMNEKSPLARTKINDLCQELLNPGPDVCDDKGNKKHSFRTGDKAVCLSNGNYNATDLKELTGGKFRVCNGEVGIVARATPDHVDFRFEGTEDGGDDHDRIIRVSASAKTLGDFALGYALTCHKCQGSEWPVVVIFADGAAGRFARKEWWYTAISRAKKRCLIFGVRAVAERQAKNKSLVSRRTRMKELFEEAAAAIEAERRPAHVEPVRSVRHSLEEDVEDAFEAYFAANPGAL